MAEETHNPLASKPGDSSKKKKRREQVIVLGTILLVVLTFVLVIRHGSNAATPTNPSNGFQPDASGYPGGDTNAALPGEVGAIPGQVQALQQPDFTFMENQLSKLRKQLATVRKQNKRELKKENRIENQLKHLRHPHHPHHPIKVVHHGTGKHPKQHHSQHLTNAQWQHLTRVHI